MSEEDDPEGFPPAEERVARALGRMGPSILLSAACETVAFGLGALVGSEFEPALFESLLVLRDWIDGRESRCGIDISVVQQCPPYAISRFMPRELCL